MCHINRETPGPAPKSWGNDIWQYIFNGPGWMRNDSKMTFRIRCIHRDNSVHTLDLRPGEVLHATADDKIIRVIDSWKTQNHENKNQT